MEVKKYFHLQPFGATNTRIKRFQSLVRGADVWCAKNGWNGKVRYDAVTFNKAGMLDHVENAGYSYGLKNVRHTSTITESL